MRGFNVFVLVFALLIAGCLSGGGEKMPETVVVAPDTRVAMDYLDSPGESGIAGQVMEKETGMPLEGAYVNIYPDKFSNLLGPSQFISEPTDAQGRYRLQVPAGTYYVVARKRLSGQPTGPLSPGDFYSEHERVIARVVADKKAMVNLPMVVMKAPMFFKKGVVDQSTRTGVKGVLVDARGKPVAGGFAAAYTTDDIKRLPDYVSTLSDSEGRFTLYLPRGGSYYLAARIHAWDMPLPGELYGMLANNPVIIENDQFVVGLRIPMAPFTGEYKPGKSQRAF